MSGGGGNQQTTVSQATPYAPAMPYLEQAMRDAAKMYSQGGTQYTPWSQVAGPSAQQLASQQGILNYVQSPGTRQFIQGAQGTTANQMMGGTNYNQPISGYAQNQLGGYLNQGSNLASNAGMLNQMAYGDTSNPYIDTQVRSALDQMSNAFLTNTLPGLRRAAIGQGTYGSSRNALAEGQAGSALESQMSEAANKAYMGAYQTSEQNRLQALQQMAQQQGQGAQNAYNLMQQGAGTNLANIAQGLGSYNQSLAMPLDMMNQAMQIGNAQQQQEQAQLQDMTNRWNFQQQSGWDTLAKFKNLIDATSQLGGVSATSQQMPQQNIIGNVAGGLMQAAPAIAGAMGSGSTGTSTAANNLQGNIATQGGFSNWAQPSSMGFSNSMNVSGPSYNSGSNWGSNMFSSLK